MEKELRFKIIQEGMQTDVKATCAKYGISRTIYYRWLQRYKTFGMEGLADRKKRFVPANKTKPDTESAILALVKTYPKYGPKALRYLAEESQLAISESAIFNILKRNQLTSKQARCAFARKHAIPQAPMPPSLQNIAHGEAWMFWITHYGNFEGCGTLYEYTLYDLASRIACSRIYQSINIQYVKDLFEAVALPVALSLQLRPKILCQWKESQLKLTPKNCASLLQTMRSMGMDLQLVGLDPITPAHQPFYEKKQQYTQTCMTYVLPEIQKKQDYETLKATVQEYNRLYNLHYKQAFHEEKASPIEHYNNKTQTRIILPLWAYLKRPY